MNTVDRNIFYNYNQSKISLTVRTLICIIQIEDKPPFLPHRHHKSFGINEILIHLA